MKKLALIANESVFSGSAKTAVGETVDSLANAIGKKYDTYVICPDGYGILTKFPQNMRKFGPYVRTCKVFGVTYYLINQQHWPELGWEVVNTIKADILHNFSDVEGYLKLSYSPSKIIYSFDKKEIIENVENIELHLSKYDAVRVWSKEYARKLLAQENKLGTILANLSNFDGVINGIATPAYSPEKGLLIASKYSANNQAGKETCKEKICKIYGIPKDKVIFLMMCHLNNEKGMGSVLQCLPIIRDNNGILLLAGEPSEEFKSQLNILTRKEGVILMHERPNPLKAIPLLAGADFYLNPSIQDPGGLLPMQASRYGTVPVITYIDALVDNFNEENAIIVENNDLAKSIRKAFELYADKESLQKMRKACMDQDFSWNNRKAAYTDIYDEP